MCLYNACTVFESGRMHTDCTHVIRRKSSQYEITRTDDQHSCSEDDKCSSPVWSGVKAIKQAWF